MELERKQCSNQSLGGFGHHGTYKQGTLKEAPVGSPRDTSCFPTNTNACVWFHVYQVLGLSSQLNGGRYAKVYQGMPSVHRSQVFHTNMLISDVCSKTLQYCEACLLAVRSACGSFTHLPAPSLLLAWDETHLSMTISMTTTMTTFMTTNITITIHDPHHHHLQECRAVVCWVQNPK